jgi:L-lactate dehydrogenase
MIDRLFATYGNTDSPTTVRLPRKGVIIGAGQVGMACAYSMLIQSTVAEKYILVGQSVHKGRYPHKRSMTSWVKAECRVTDMSQPLT